MKIQDMFVKDITRDLEGVIVVGEGDVANQKQELDEYVITRELLRHFKEFFANYKQGIIGRTTKTGVWISGFFGSGKSHFLKMLAYLLENKEVDGKRAIQYLIDNHQIQDSMLLADMKLAAETPTDVILFNIDSKSEQTGKQSKDAIVMVFLKVFNEMQGFCGSMPYVADLERQLDKEGRYEEFQERFQEKFGAPWKESTNEFYYIQDIIVDVLSEMGFMSEAAARNWLEKAGDPYRISIEGFAKMVRSYIESKGKNHHVVFMVDEVGQYIGDNSQMMLNLQTLREELGKECQGKAWLIATSQQDIDSITQVKGDDFSKIQGRFDTRISLSSANVDEVIRERILRKTPTAAQTLRLVYDQKSTQLSNIITFDNTPEMKLYSSREDFAAVYPFIPYQFHLLGSVLTSIRTHGASGKHLSEGERSMLALFKESAEAIKDGNEEEIVPFYRFYDALESFLDAAHSRVIQQALDNRRINPDRQKSCFAVNVLKCLFLIKYVKELENATLENITSLMISNVNEDRGALSEKVEDALQILIRETLVEEQNHRYVFLTEEEQEIGREIEGKQVEISEVREEIAETFYDDIYKETRYKYSKFNGRYTFPFNRAIDEEYYKSNPGSDIGIRLLTPYTESGTDELTLRLRSGEGKEILVLLPDDSSYMNEIRRALKIEKYLRDSASQVSDRFSDIRNKKQKERSECLRNAKRDLQDALGKAVLYVNGDRMTSSSGDVSTRLGEALERLVGTVYHKLYYIDTPFQEDSIRRMFTADAQRSLNLEEKGEPNDLAQKDVLSYITGNSDLHTKTSMKSLRDKFMKAPYGFIKDDVEWIVARLFRKGQITLTLNGSPVTMQNRKPEELFHLFTKKEYIDKLMAQYREKSSKKEIRNAKDLAKELFSLTILSDDEDVILSTFQTHADNLLQKLENRKRYDYTEKDNDTKKYPGKEVVETGIKLLQDITGQTEPSEFYPKLLKKKEELYDFAEDYEPVNNFFNGEQKRIFDDALRQMAIYEESRVYIVDKPLEDTVASIQKILKSRKPYREIPKLPALLETYRELYGNLLDEEEAPVIASIEEERDRVLEVLRSKSYAEENWEDFNHQFDDLKKAAEACNNITILRSYTDQAKAVKKRLLTKMDHLDEKEVGRRAAEAEQGKYASAAGAKNGADRVSEPSITPVKPKKKKKYVDVKTITMTSSWQIETEDDIDACLRKFREQLEQQLEENTIVNIEF